MADTATAQIPDQGIMPVLAAGRGPLYNASVGPLDGIDVKLPELRSSISTSKNTNTTKAPTIGSSSPADLVGYYESNDNYNAGYSGVDVSKYPEKPGYFGFPDWPGEQGPQGITHAAGRYQFEPDTWRRYAGPLGITDFSPASQDKVFKAAFDAEGWKPWAPYNPRLRDAIGANLDSSTAGSLESYQQAQTKSNQLISERQASLDKLIASLGSSKGDSQERRKLLQDSLDRSRALQDEMLQLAHNPPTQKPTDLMSTFGSLAMLIGAIGGLRSRQPATAALEAAAGVIEGVHANNTEEFNRNYKTWQTQSKLLEELTGIQSNDFRTILENDRLDETERHNQLEEKLHEWGMGNSLMQLQLGNLQEAWKGPLSVMEAHEHLTHIRAQNEELLARAALARKRAETGTPANTELELFRDLQTARDSGDPEQITLAEQAIKDFNSARGKQGGVHGQEESTLFKNLEDARASGDESKIKEAQQAIRDFNETRGKVRHPLGAQGIFMQKVLEEKPELTSKELQEAMGEYRRIQALESGFANGLLGRNVVALNTVADHIMLTREYFNALKNGQIPRANQIANIIAVESGKPEVTSFETGRGIMAGEVVRLLTSTGGTESDRKNMNDHLKSFASPPQGAGVLTAFERFVAGRFEALEQQYAQNDPKRKERFVNDLLTEKSRKIFVETSGRASETGKYNSPDDIYKALDKGEITKDQAKDTLIKQFGYTPTQ